MKSFGEADLFEVIDRIYAAGMSFDQWPEALTRMADLLGARDASLGAMSPDALPWIFAPRTDPAFMQTYAENYHPMDGVWHGVTRRGVDRPATDAMVMPRDELVKSAFHNEWSRPQGYQTIMGGMILAERGWRTVLMLPGQEAFGLDELRLLATLTPHVRRAVQLNLRLAQGDLNQQFTVGLLEQMATAAFVVDADGALLFANGAAEPLFRRGRPLRAVGGRVTASRPDDAAQLQAMIGRCAAPASAGGDLRLRQDAGPDMLLQFAPIRRETPLLGPGMPVAIVFDTSSQPPSNPTQHLRTKYDLTAAEAAFALEIVKGDGKRAAAERRGVSYATARTQLQRIFEKTGVHRQAELVRLLIADLGPPGV